MASPRASPAATLIARLSLPGSVTAGGRHREALRRLPTSPGAPNQIDQALGGGLIEGRLNELTGPPSSGRTSLLQASLAAATHRGEVVALVDLPDAFDPRSALAAGIDLHRLLWVRPPSLRTALRATEDLLQAGGLAIVALDLGELSIPIPAPDRVRLAHAAARTRTACFLLGKRRMAGTFASLSLALGFPRTLWNRPSDLSPPLLAGLESRLAVVRNRLGPPGATTAISFLLSDT